MKNRLPHLSTALTGVMALAIAGCNTEGQDPLQPRLEMSIVTPQIDANNPIPVIPEGVDISCGFQESSRPVYVEISRADGGAAGIPDTEDFVQAQVSWDDGRATISRLNRPDDDDEEDECRKQYGAVPANLSAGRATFFLTGIVAGNVQFRASAVTEDGVSLEANKTLRVGSPGSGTPQHFVLFGPVPQTVPLNTPRTFVLTVVDEGGNRVTNPSGDDSNLSLTMQDGAPTGTELIDPETGASGQTLDLATDNGQARFTIRGGFESGNVRIAATATDTSGNADDGFTPPVVVYGFDVTAVGVGELHITTDPELRPASPGVDYPVRLEAAGGSGALTWSIIAGGLPEGLELDPDTGFIDGRVSNLAASGVYGFFAQVEDAQGNTAMLEFNLPVQGTDGPPDDDDDDDDAGG